MSTAKTATIAITTGAFSDEGKRPNQEDRFLIHEFLTRDGLNATLLLVADGIGGQSTGELASSIAQDAIPRHLEAAQPTASEMTKALAEAIIAANQSIYQESMKDMSRTGMGTTCTAVVIIGKRLYLGHVGDSRAYLLRNQSLRQLTVDHTWAEEALQHGRSIEEIRNHPNRGVLKRFLGIEPHVEVDTRYRVSSIRDDYEDAREKPLFLEPTDTIMLCSDGVSDILADAQIEAILSKHPAPKAAETLVKEALKGGASDNVTAVVADMPEAVKGGGGAATPPWLWPALGALLLILLLAGAGFFLFKQKSSSPDKETPSAVAAQQAATPTLSPTKMGQSESATAAPVGGGAIVNNATPTSGGDSDATTASGEGAAGAVPTLVPTPTDTPTPLPQQTRKPSSRPKNAPSSSTDFMVNPAQPPDNELLNNGKALFKWQVINGALGPKQKYELVFYHCDQPPKTGFSPVAATREMHVEVNLVGTDDNADLPFDTGEWCWALFAGHERKDGSWKRDLLLISDRHFNYQRPGGGSDGGDTSPAPPPPK